MILLIGKIEDDKITEDDVRTMLATAGLGRMNTVWAVRDEEQE